MQTIGDRITYCRSVLGYTRSDLIKAWGNSSTATLARWETDLIIPASAKLDSLTRFFFSKGLIVSLEWLEKGQGLAPIQPDLQTFSEDKYDIASHQSFRCLNQQLKGLKYYKVTSNFFAPTIYRGDYIAGIEITTDLQNYVDNLVLLVQDNTVYVGLLGYDDHVFLKNTSGKILRFANYQLLAKINWMAIKP